jgi:hypothetical protein
MPADTARASAKPPRVKSRFSAYSHDGAFSRIDGRCREARFLRARRTELIGYLGGNVNPVQRQLIERAVRLMLHLELLDERLTRESGFNGHDHVQYLAWSNGVVRTLARLGIREPARTKRFPPQSVHDLVGAT